MIVQLSYTKLCAIFKNIPNSAMLIFRKQHLQWVLSLTFGESDAIFIQS